MNQEEQSVMFLTSSQNEDDDSNQGFILFQTPESQIIAMYWADEVTKKNSFHSMEYFYDQAKLMVGSAITHLSPLHESKTKMCKEFISYYETYTGLIPKKLN